MLFQKIFIRAFCFITLTQTIYAADIQEFLGPCDASAGIAISAQQFLIANDEENTIRLYDVAQKQAISSWDLSAALNVNSKSPEADLEGAAQVGKNIFWIGSHGANKNGKNRPNRHVLFATQMNANNTQLKMSGSVYTNLILDLSKLEELKSINLLQASTKAPEEDGALNIEGLAQTQNNGLWIGFRNPLPNNKAILVELTNPTQVTQGKPAQFGKVHFLNLNGLGIRSIEWNLTQKNYWIVAGPHNNKGSFALYKWQPTNNDLVQIAIPMNQAFTPEGLFFFSNKAFFVNDNGKSCNQVKPTFSIRTLLVR